LDFSRGRVASNHKTMDSGEKIKFLKPNTALLDEMRRDQDFQDKEKPSWKLKWKN